MSGFINGRICISDRIAQSEEPQYVIPRVPVRLHICPSLSCEIWQSIWDRDCIKLLVLFHIVLCTPYTFEAEFHYSGTVCHGSKWLTIKGRRCGRSRIAQSVWVRTGIPSVPSFTTFRH
jgi:hypothetical protein